MKILAFILRKIARWLDPNKSIGECLYIDYNSEKPLIINKIIVYNSKDDNFNWMIKIGRQSHLIKEVAKGWAISVEIANEFIVEYSIKLGLK